MYEGKNIHYSPVDSKPLCSFSTKICKQRRLNGYAFCVRHILEDPTAPFRQCCHCTHSKHKCTNAIPKNEERIYCNNHMQMLGMIPKRERRNKRERDKEKEHGGAGDNNKMSLHDRLKSKFNLTQKEDRTNHTTAAVFDDPYAFPDEPAPPPAKVVISTPTPPVSLDMPAPSPVAARSPMAIGNKSPVSARSPGGIRCQQTNIPGGKSPVHGRPPEGISAAKLYPELAEKLHMEKSKSRPESKSKFGPRSSRTVNQLENKIAQNKIKMKKNQESPIDNHSASSSPKIMPSIFSPLQRTTSLPSDSSSHLSALFQMRSNFCSSIGSTPHPPPYLSAISNSSNAPDLRVPIHPHPSLHEYPATQNPAIKMEHRGSDFQLPAYSPLDSSQNFRKVRLRKPRKVLPESEARVKLKGDAAVQVYGYYAKRQLYNSDLLPSGFDTSDSDDDSDIDALPWQRVCFTPSSDEEMESDDSQEDSLPIKRMTRLASMRARLRRRMFQLRRNLNTNASSRHYHRKISETLLDAVHESPRSTVAAILAMRKKEELVPPTITKSQVTDKRQCLHKTEGNTPCPNPVLPFANQCRKHIMYNVDQQLFDYCTARCPDNAQCCDPVFDIRHDFPLCPKHAALTDYETSQGHKSKKPRKKTKPSALTRPPKRGKKKKNQKRLLRPQKPMPPTEPSGDIDGLLSDGDGDVDVESSENMTEDMGMDSPEIPSPPSLLPDIPTPLSRSSRPIINPAVERIARDLAKLDHLALTNEFSPTIERSLDLDQATKLLEDHDINEVLNKLPDEAFDIFTGKNGEYNIPTHEETEELERALAAVSETVNRTKESLGKMGLIEETSDDDELAKHIADTILHQHLHQDNLTSFGDDNLHDLANSISEHDLKTMSQVLTNSALSTALDVGNDKLHLDLPTTSTAQPVAVALDQAQLQGLLGNVAGNVQTTQGHFQGIAPGQVVQIPSQFNTAYGIIMNGAYGTATVQNYPIIQTSYQSPVVTQSATARSYVPNVTVNNVMHNSLPLQLNPDVLTSQMHATVERLASPMHMHSSPGTPSPLPSPAPNPQNPWTNANRIPTTAFQNGYPVVGQLTHASNIANGGPKLTLNLPQVVQQGDIVRTAGVATQRPPYDARTTDAIFQVAVSLPLNQPYTVNSITTQVQHKS